MTTKEVKIIQVGNSKGVRLPKSLLVKYGLHEVVLIQETEEGILIKSGDNSKLSWEDTFSEIASSGEDWSDWNEVDMGEFGED
jgi:antitoxin MazE